MLGVVAAVVTARPAASSSALDPPYMQSEAVHRSASRFTASPTLKALAQQCVDSAEDETTFERFAAELSTGSLSPRVMLAYGHSGSSAAMMFTHEMLEAHGLPAPTGLLPMELLKWYAVPPPPHAPAAGRLAAATSLQYSPAPSLHLPTQREDSRLHLQRRARRRAGPATPRGPVGARGPRADPQGARRAAGRPHDRRLDLALAARDGRARRGGVALQLARLPHQLGARMPRGEAPTLTPPLPP